MSRNLLNLSKKIDSLTIRLFEDITNIAGSMGIPFFVVGATARDIILTYGYGVNIVRATSDIDFGVQVSDFDQYEKLKKELISSGLFELTNEIQRLKYKSSLLIDIVPFGAIMNRDGSVYWPPDHEVKMNALGFIESYENAVNVRLRESPVLEIPFATLAGLAIMKIISWNDNYPERKKDALDLSVIMRYYLDAGNEDRLFESEVDIIESLQEAGGVDYLKAGARMLGRDMEKIAEPESKKKIIEIFERETSEQDRYKLVEDMIDISFESSSDFEELFDLLKQLKLGFLDKS